MFEEGLFRLLSVLERLGLWPSIVAWLVVASGCVVMAFALRAERRLATWIPAAVVAGVALAANLTDYMVTLALSPDLAAEANPLWRNVLDAWGLQVAKWYGLTGKLFVSVLAGQMFAFYLANLSRLYPRRARSLVEFLRKMGDRSNTLGDRALALFTLFAFFFAGIQLLYFYIAFLNWLDGAPILHRLPSVPLAIVLLLLGISTAFALVSYRGFGRIHSADPTTKAARAFSSAEPNSDSREL